MATSKYLKQIGDYADKIVNGTLLAIDPGSTRPGYAVFIAGICTHSGALKIPPGTIYERLQSLATQMNWLVKGDKPAVTVIEELRGSMVHMSLAWAVGVHLSAAGTTNIVELPIWAWKAEAKYKPGYFKDDVQDAIIIGETTIKLARELQYAQAVNPYLLRTRSNAAPKPRKTTARSRKKLEQP